MAKAKTVSSGTETIEAALKDGTETLKDGFDKAVQGYEQLVAFGKDNAEAVLKSANVAGKSIEAINAEVLTYSRAAVEESIFVTKAIMASKSVQEVIEIQSDFAKSAFETYVAEMTKVRDLFMTAAKQSAAPIQARVTAFADLVQNAKAA
jgi:phasin family protein